MQTRNLQRAVARALTTITMLCASACAPVDDAWDEPDALQAREPSGDAPLVRDDFEQGTVSPPTWRKSGDVRVRIDAARTGAFGVQLGRRAALVAQLDTRGHGDLALRFDARAVDLERGEVLRVELSVGGRLFVPIAYVRDAAWATRTVRLPRVAEDRADVRVRFVVLAADDFGRERSFEGALIDNVAITAHAERAYDDEAPLR